MKTAFGFIHGLKTMGLSFEVRRVKSKTFQNAPELNDLTEPLNMAHRVEQLGRADWTPAGALIEQAKTSSLNTSKLDEMCYASQ